MGAYLAVLPRVCVCVCVCMCVCVCVCVQNECCAGVCVRLFSFVLSVSSRVCFLPGFLQATSLTI